MSGSECSMCLESARRDIPGCCYASISDRVLYCGYLKLIDSYGHAWICEARNDQDDVSLCGVYSGWVLFRHTKLLFEGTYISLGVTSADPTSILFEFKRPI